MIAQIKTFLGLFLDRDTVRFLLWVLFFAPLALYHIRSGTLLDRPWALDLGTVTAAAMLGGLTLNAGLSLRGPKGQEVVKVAQKFIWVVILMIMFPPALYFVELMGNIDLSAFEPGVLGSWVRAFFFFVGASAFYLGISLFICALVDLAYAISGIENVSNMRKSSPKG